MTRQKIAVHLENVSKTFYIREKSADSIRAKFKNVFQRKNDLHVINAVQDVTLDIRKGEFFGIIGHNGSGKSTLLKLIIGAIKPDNGSIIETEGKVLRLALGMGFDYNLSARHNIYVNGSIMGLTFREIGRKFHDIIDFAGLEDFIDTPIKYFSSGMVSRLAFAISVYVESDILLMDEFFGVVGDESFKQKSNEIFKKRIIDGKTVLFVSHELSAIKKYCSKLVIMNKGRMSRIYDVNEGIEMYLKEYQDKV